MADQSRDCWGDRKRRTVNSAIFRADRSANSGMRIQQVPPPVPPTRQIVKPIERHCDARSSRYRYHTSRKLCPNVSGSTAKCVRPDLTSPANAATGQYTSAQFFNAGQPAPRRLVAAAKSTSRSESIARRLRNSVSWMDRLRAAHHPPASSSPD